MHNVPTERPKDLYLSFKAADARLEVCEGEEGNLGDYYLRVERVYRRIYPGKYSMLAIARLSDSLTTDLVIESLKAIMR